MRTITLNNKLYTEVDVSLMELNQIQLLIEELQSEIFKKSSEKRKLCTLPACKKDVKTLKKVAKLTDELSELQIAQTWVGRIKKQKRDTMSKEKQWFRAAFISLSFLVRKGLLEKVIKETNEKLGYTIDLPIA